MKAIGNKSALNWAYVGVLVWAATAVYGHEMHDHAVSNHVADVTNAAVHVELEDKVIITDIRVEDTVYTPYYEVQTEQDHNQGSAQRWIRLGVYFTTEGGWIDELDINQKAILREKGSEKNVMLSETVHYINIEPGDHYVYVYLHPSYVKRYDLDSFDLDTAASISINGNVLASEETHRHQEKGWALNKCADGGRGYLLNHSETPFWFINYDFKEIIKREDSTRK